jgi:peptidoglycan/xylan/chitin deacetylase (PgdA/CDA1 family)
MSVAELKAFATSPSVAIGAHTEHHPSLGYLSAEDQRHEILTSADQLEKWLGKRPDYFSYPFGTGADYNETSISICTEAGFKHTAANYPGLVHKKSPRHAFPRFLVRDWNKAEFEKQLHAFFNS